MDAIDIVEPPEDRQIKGSNSRTESTPDTVSLLVGELTRVHERVFSSAASTATIIQFIIVIFVGGVVAAAEFRAAFAAVPVFWSVWMLHSLLTDRDTIKMAEYAKWLETEANQLAGRTIWRWETDLAARSHKRELIYNFSYVYWGAINLAAWAIGIYLTFDNEEAWMGWSLAVTGCGVWAVTAYTVATRSRFQANVRHEVAKQKNPA